MLHEVLHCVVQLSESGVSIPSSTLLPETALPSPHGASSQWVLIPLLNDGSCYLKGGETVVMVPKSSLSEHVLFLIFTAMLV